MIRKSLRTKMRRFKRKISRWNVMLPAFIALLIVAGVGYAEYMSNRRLSVNPDTTKSLLNLIGTVESSNNYNAHFGNARNSTVRFTDMTIAEVLQWQKKFVQDGSPSSAVGRYQIINTTLSGLVRELRLNDKQKFDPPTQDRMAIALLERRGAEEYVNEEITQKEFAANLAKEWAALPKMIGDNPDDSYYAGDGLNKARVETKEILKAIDPIEPKV